MNARDSLFSFRMRRVEARRDQHFPRCWSRGPFYVEQGDGLLVWIGPLRFKVQFRVWWSRG